MTKRAIILAGGKGTRLKPYTITIPKPLVPIGETAVLEIIIKQLKDFGFGHITLAVNHHADLIKAYFGDGAKWDVKIDYSLEKTPLSTMGPIKIIKDLPENFLVMNGDVLTDLDLNSFLENHIKSRNIFTIAANKRIEKIDYGVLKINDSNQLIGFHEKPDYSFMVSMGIYALNKSVLELIPENKPYGFDSLMLSLISLKKHPSVHIHQGYWLDIGRPEDYEKANQESIKFLNL